MAGLKAGKSPVVWLAGATAIAAILLGWYFLPVEESIQAFSDWIRGLGALGVAIFMLTYMLAVVTLAPASLASIAAGLIFGVWGFPVVLVAASIGAALAFLVSRHLLRGTAESVVKRKPLFEAVDHAVADEGWRIVALLRLSPLVPFGLQNYFFGATAIGFWPFAIATAAGIIPGTALYVYLGTLGQAALQGDAGGGLKIGALVVGLLASVAVIFFVSKKTKEKLREIGVRKSK